MNLNTNYSSQTNTDLYGTHFRSEENDFFRHLSNAIDSALTRADDEITKDIHWISTKFDGIIKKFKSEITPKNLVKQSKDFIRAKVMPMSSPPGWDDAMKKATSMRRVMRGVKSERVKLLTAVENQMIKASSFQKGCLESQRSHLRNGIVEMGENLEAVDKYIVYLNKMKQNKINSRFGGYCSSLSNLILPGSGSLVGSLNTGLQLVNDEKLAASLPGKLNLTVEEKRKVRNSTMASVALSIATLAFTFYALPIIKASALQFMKNSLNIEF